MNVALRITTMKCFFRLLFVLVGGLVAGSPTDANQSPFLKEILQGRCYDTPPSGNVDDCPAIVGSFMNVIESHKSADISPSDFDAYLTKADFFSPTDKALMVVHFFGSPVATTATLPPAGLVSPFDTPGGKLLKDLVFCGVDQHNNCSIETSNAYWTFWEAGTLFFVLPHRYALF